MNTLKQYYHYIFNFFQSKILKFLFLNQIFFKIFFIYLEENLIKLKIIKHEIHNN